MVKSLDPRVNRLPYVGSPLTPTPALDQLGTFEVFVQPREGKPFQHEGVVHAPDAEMAFILAKESFTRRFTCVSLWVAETARVFVSLTTEDATSAYEMLPKSLAIPDHTSAETFEIFHLAKRGKQHTHFRSIQARDPVEAMILAKELLDPSSVFYNIWAIRARDIRKTRPEEKDLWTTLPEKKFRDALAYKGGDKLKELLERNPGTP